MKRAADELGQILNYEKLTAIRFLEVQKIDKEEIPNFIFCPKFQKAKTRMDQAMERYQNKVNRFDDEIQQIKLSMVDMEKQHNKWVRKSSTFMLDRTDVKQVEKQNHAVDQAERLGNQIARAGEKHNDLIDRHREATAEADEKLQDLTEEALVVIDEDIVAVLDKCTKIVEKLSGGQNTEDIVAAVEICLMELRVFTLFEDHIEGNTARKDCRDRIADVTRLLTELCADEHVKNYFSDLFRRTAHVVQKNGEIYSQIVRNIDAIDRPQLTEETQSVTAVLALEFDTNFEYEGVVDPVELDGIVTRIKSTIAALKGAIEKSKQVIDATATTAQAAVGAHQSAETLLTSMKSGTDGTQNDIISDEHFGLQMIEEEVIDGFYPKDLRPAVVALRQHIVDAVGEEFVDNLVTANDDRYSLGKAENAIAQANLVCLQDVRDKIDGHVKNLTDLITKAEEDTKGASDVPQQNADALRSELGLKYILSCLPGIGPLFAIGILGRLKEFELAFRSSNQIYEELGSGLLAKNSKMTIVVIVLGVVLGIGGMAAFFALEVGSSTAVNVGVPGAVLALYLITSGLLVSAGKRLRSYLGTTDTAASEANSAEGTNQKS